MVRMDFPVMLACVPLRRVSIYEIIKVLSSTKSELKLRHRAEF